MQEACNSFGISIQLFLLRVVLGEDGEDPVAGPAGTTMRLSLSDWSKFVADHLRGDRGEPALLKPDTYRFLHKPPLGGHYALGWSVAERPWGNGRVLTHSGCNGTNFSVVWIAPERDFAVLACTNQGSPSAESGVDAAASQLVNLYEKRFPAANSAEIGNKSADQ